MINVSSKIEIKTTKKGQKAKSNQFIPFRVQDAAEYVHVTYCE